MKKERFDFIDVAKGIGIVLVLIGHSKISDPYFNYIYGFHMPLFFIISGFLYDSGKWAALGLKELIKNKFKAYIIPYFVLAFINLFINIPIEYFSKEIVGKDLLVSTVKHFFWIFYSTSSSQYSPNCSPLWFLCTIFLSYILLYFLFKAKNMTVVLLFIVASVSACKYILTLTTFTLPWHINTAAIGTVFMLCGFLIRKYREFLYSQINILSIAMLTIIGSYAILTNKAVNMTTANMANPVLYFVGAISMSLVVLSISSKYIKSNPVLSGEKILYCL